MSSLRRALACLAFLALLRLPAAGPHTDGVVSEEVLRGYLSRSMTLMYLLSGQGDLDDNIRMMKETGVKFAGRAVYNWGREQGGESRIPDRLGQVRANAAQVHAADPDIILQGCVFEIVTDDVNRLSIPAWVFEELGEPVETRNFRFDAMGFANGWGSNHWGRATCVPDVSQAETRRWFHYLAGSFIDAGCEAIHFGQAEMMGRNDPDLRHWDQVLAKAREHARLHARRHFLLCDAHVPGGGLVREGRLLLDFHTFPLRIEELPDQPRKARLRTGFTDAIYGRSRGGLTPSGWRCEHLPYLVEFDNYGRSRMPGEPGQGRFWVWGWDEVTWFSEQPEADRNEWLRYAWNWVRDNDPAGYVQMPGIRCLSGARDGRRFYYANRNSASTPDGYGQEETIRKIWSGDAAGHTPPASPGVATALQPYLDGHKLAGYVALLGDRTGAIRFRNVAGMADVEAGRPIGEHNVFWIASMTKMFAGASIMMLVDEGKVSLDDPVTRFIPELSRWMVVAEKDADHVLLRPVTRPVTLRHVLSHTSGLTGSSELQQVTGSDRSPLRARALSSVTGPLQWQPGEKYQYGNQGMNIAARVVEIVSGMPYEDFLQKRFFDPLGMSETTFWPDEAQVARLAGAYGSNREKTGLVRGKVGFLSQPFGDRARRFPEAGGGLFSTAHDLFRYGLMLANDGELDGRRYLSHAAMEELRKEQTGTTKVNYSLGYHLRNGMFGHDGAYGTDLSVNPATGMVALFLVQCPGPDQWAARDHFLKAATAAFGR